MHGFCCPSAMESEATEHGFRLLDFSDEKRVSVALYHARRDGKGYPRWFERDAESRIDIDLSSEGVDEESAKTIFPTKTFPNL